jgi:hypothetical protein
MGVRVREGMEASGSADRCDGAVIEFVFLCRNDYSTAKSSPGTQISPSDLRAPIIR